MARFFGTGTDLLALEHLSIHAIRRWRIVVVACVGVLLLAWMAWAKLPRLEDPRVEPTHMVVTIPYPGASPEDVETQVVKVVEGVLYAMDGVEYVEASAIPNAALFHLKLEDKTPMDLAVERVRGKVQATKKDLPSGVKDPEVVRFSTSNAPQMILAVAGNRSEAVLTTAAKRVKDEVTAVDGVAGVDLRGDSERAVRVRVDAVRLAESKLSADDVVRALNAANVRIPAGELRTGPVLAMLHVNHSFSDAASVARVPVGMSSDARGGTRTIVLGDVAEVTDDSIRPKSRFTAGGMPAVAVEVRFRSEENAVAVGKQVRARIARVLGTMPPGVEIRVAHDQPAWIDKSLATFIGSLGEGMILVLVVITLGMGWRAALVASAALPLSVGATVFGLYVLGFSLEQISIAGLIVALGLLVDDSVVVTESIQTMRDKGLGPVRAAVLGTARVFWANNGTTAVACAAFLPLFLMGGATGMFVRGLPTAVVLSLVASLVVAQVVTPWLASLVVRNKANVRSIPDHEPFDPREDTTEADDESNPILRALKAAYARGIPFVLAHPGKVIAISVALLVGSLALLPRVGFQFFPKADKPVLFVSLDLPRGTPFETAADKAREALALLAKDASVEDTSATIGGGYAPIFYARPPRTTRDLVDILVRLRAGASASGTAGRLRRDLAAIPGVSLSVDELYYGPPVTHPIIVRLFGSDYGLLRTYADEVKGMLRAQPGAINIKDSLMDSIPVANVEIDADRALRAGLTPGQVGSTLRLLYGEDKVTDFRRGDDQVQVVLEGPRAGASPVGQVEAIPVPSLGGRQVALHEAGEVAMGHGYAELMRRNGIRIVEITADVEAITLPAEIVGKLDPWLRAKEWAPGYGFKYAGVQEETEKSFASLGMAAAGALVLIFLLLVLMFDSLVDAFVVLAAVPFALIGAVTGLAVTGNPFGFMAFLGLIALIGVYVNHKIYFVDRVRELTSRGEDLASAIRGAGRDRLRPVVLTAMTAILGLLPLTLSGGRLWASFGWVNIFGLAASIPLSLVLLPACLLVAHRVTHRAERRTGASGAEPSTPSSVYPDVLPSRPS